MISLLFEEAAMKMTMALLCLITQNAFCLEEPEENVTYPYPFVYDPDTDSKEDSKEKKSKSKSSEKESKDVWHGKLGKADVTIETKNVDPASQRQAEWDKIRNEHKPKKEEKKSKSSFKKDDEEEEEDHSPSVQFRIEWGDD